MLIGEIIGRIRGILSKGVSSDDMAYNDRFIYNIIRGYRSTLIRKLADNHKYISSQNYSNSICIPFKYEALYNCECFSSDCKALISKYNIPSVISHSNGILLTLRTLDGNKIDVSSLEEQKYNLYSRTKKNTPGFFIFDNKVVITGHQRLKVAVLSGVFENPLELHDLPSCDDSGDEIPNRPCYSPLTEPFAMDDSLIMDLLNLTYTELIKLGLSVRRDLTNDSQDNAGPPDARG